jgi:SAM-dependent methyltransferase
MGPTPGSKSSERLTPNAAGDPVVEHLHRYAFAREFAAGRDVLDVACGEGYGSALLAEVAHSVAGVDLDDATITQAAQKYQRPNLRWLAGSAAAIPLAAAAVDLVVSFETIEHLAARDEMLAEVRRVLRPGGLLIISSPDRREYSEAAHYRNPFHVKELDAAEFEALLRRFFASVVLLGQRMIYGSAIAPTLGILEFRTFAGTFEKVSTIPGVPAARYLVAVCSDAPLPALPASIFEDALERRALTEVDAALRVEPAARGIVERLRRAIGGESGVQLARELDCKIRSFTVTLAGHVPVGTRGVRARLREKIFEGRIEGAEFAIEVNLGSGRHPCVIELCDESGAWRETQRVRVEAPEVTFKAHERDR